MECCGASPIEAESAVEVMPTFARSVLIAAPVAAVFGFHERDDALALLSPPFPRVRVISKAGGIEAGTRVELQIGPFRWVALHSAFEKDRFFEDRQVSGPFASWVHRHEFEAVGHATRLTDRIEFRLSGGLWMNQFFGWAVQLGLQQMFRHRHRVTKSHCEKGFHESLRP
jgi:ligand-binding SRPBCC domain-containing protein